MKVINEDASRDIINSIRDAYNNASNIEEKENVFEQFSELVDPKVLNSIKKIISFGEPFLDSWIKSMKWEELAKGDNNELIRFFDISGGNGPAFNSIRNFVKMYNSYADGYFSDRALDNGSLVELLNNNNLYNFNEKDFVNVIRVFDYVAKKTNNLNRLRSVFYENPNDPQNSRINSLRTIYSLSGEGKSYGNNNSNISINNMNNNQLNNLVNQLMKDKRFVDIVRSKLK